MPQDVRSRCFRLGTRALMLGTAAVALELCLIREIMRPPQGRGVGHTPVRIDFEVRDADTDQPIDGAMITLEDPSFADAPRRPHVLALNTGPDGTASFAIDATVYAVQRSSWQWQHRVSYPAWRLKIEAHGYAAFTDDGTARWNQYGSRIRKSQPTSHPFVARLSRQFRPAKPESAGSR